MKHAHTHRFKEVKVKCHCHETGLMPVLFLSSAQNCFHKLFERTINNRGSSFFNFGLLRKFSAKYHLIKYVWHILFFLIKTCAHMMLNCQKSNKTINFYLKKMIYGRRRYYTVLCVTDFANPDHMCQILGVCNLIFIE